MKTNDAGLALLKQFEGCELESYKDTGGVWTIGYGSTRGVKPGMVITPGQAEDRLREDLGSAEAGVSACVKVSLSANQFAALVCFAFNVGVGALKGSTLLKKLNAGDVKGAADQFLRWNKDNGRVLAGLTRRRQAERALFLS